LRAETLFRATVGPEPLTPEEIARDYDVSVEAVREAVDYCQRNSALLKKERDEDWTDSQARGLLAAGPVASDAQSES
jgi:DNA-directed RNA polymerase sigma subunit (sigma70/sigma32)